MTPVLISLQITSTTATVEPVQQHKGTDSPKGPKAKHHGRTVNYGAIFFVITTGLSGVFLALFTIMLGIVWRQYNIAHHIS
ncbi:hypothetical protein GCK32_007060 [Trichostrongylus colubriformis]|uniref:Uncharacterized protein n=1 Tax=Trichostrongylus colubriformis TaxID=6319 RepID=A0AAN8FP81_TRICO